MKALVKILSVFLFWISASQAGSNTIDPAKLTVGIDLTYAPYAYLENGQPSGFDPDFMRLLAHKLGQEAQFKDTRIENIIIGLNAGHYDIVASALYVNAARAKQVDFLPYLQTGGVLVVRGDDSFRPQSLEELCGKSISSMKGAAWISKLNSLSDTYCLPKNLGAIKVKEFPSAPEAAQALLSKGVDVQYEDAAVAQMVSQSLNGRLVIASREMIDPVLIGLAFNKSNPELRETVRQTIDALRQSGEYEKLLKQYNLAYPNEDLLHANQSSLASLREATLQKFNWAYLSSLFFKKDFWLATLTVVELSTLTWILSGFAGLLLALASQSSYRSLQRFSGTYIWFFRSLPLLVLLIFIYNLPQAFPASSALLSSPFIAGLIALVLSESAYMAEIHRGALSAISGSQNEAGKALGIRYWGRTRLIIIPQALRIALPALTNQYVTIIKLTSLVSVISLTEILLVGQQLYTRNFLVMETLLAVAFYYVLIVSIISFVLKKLEHRLDVSTRESEFDSSIKIDQDHQLNQTLRHENSSTYALEIQNARKKFGQQLVLNNVNLNLKWGEVTSIIGPSGSGKSTLIRSINGLEILDSGKISFEGEDFLYGQDQIHLKTRQDYWQRIVRVGMVFQDFHLFPHRTVIDNIMLAPLYHQMGEAEVLRKDALLALDKVGLLAHANKYPHQLSGGQQQRVAIARALAMKPSVMLFDEPTSALDPERVKDVLSVIENLVKEGMTMLIVTHEINFAFKVSDRIIFMEHGSIIHDATPEEFENTQDARLLAFLNPGSNDYVI